MPPPHSRAGLGPSRVLVMPGWAGLWQDFPIGPAQASLAHPASPWAGPSCCGPRAPLGWLLPGGPGSRREPRTAVGGLSPDLCELRLCLLLER